MRRKEDSMSTVIEKLDTTRLEKELPNKNRMQASDLRNSKKWKALLNTYMTIEITSNGETIAQLNSPSLIPNLLQEISSLEKELEQLKIEKLYKERFSEENLLTGKELENEAHSLLEQYLRDGEIK